MNWLTSGMEKSFWENVDRRGPNECWMWVGNLQQREKPYGRFYVGGKRREVLSHRLSLMIKVGRDMEVGEMACHTCDEPRCCNPDHLYVGNALTNNRDAIARSRRVNSPQDGERNGNSKLTYSQVDEIRKRIKSGETNKSIAKDFPVGHSMISKIKQGKFW